MKRQSWGHANGLQHGSLPTANHRQASMGGAEGQESGSSKVEHQVAGPTRKDGEKDREQAR